MRVAVGRFSTKQPYDRLPDRGSVVIRGLEIGVRRDAEFTILGVGLAESQARRFSPKGRHTCVTGVMHEYAVVSSKIDATI
jgi:hypothetical protein